MPSVFEEQERRPIWLEEMNRGRGSRGSHQVSSGLSHMGPGRSWKVATTFNITAMITFHTLLLSPTGPTIPGRSHPARPGRPLSPF